MRDLLGRLISAMRNGYIATTEEAHTFLMGEGLTEYQAFLTYTGAKMVIRDNPI